MDKINQMLLTKWIREIGYDIIEIIEEVCGVSGVIANLYLAEPSIYTFGDEDEESKISKRIAEKWKIPETSIDLDVPIALTVLFILENGEIYDQQT